MRYDRAGIEARSAPIRWPDTGPGATGQGKPATKGLDMSAPKRVERPLSPFMIGPYYRPQMTSISSIMVRITGIATLGTVVLVVAWLLAAATSAPAFDCVNWLLTSIVGDIVMTLAAWAVWYHVLGRLRHLIWDLGYLVEVKANEVMGLGMFIGATLLTIITVIVV